MKPEPVNLSVQTSSKNRLSVVGEILYVSAPTVTLKITFIHMNCAIGYVRQETHVAVSSILTFTNDVK